MNASDGMVRYSVYLTSCTTTMQLILNCKGNTIIESEKRVYYSYGNGNGIHDTIHKTKAKGTYDIHGMECRLEIVMSNDDTSLSITRGVQERDIINRDKEHQKST